MEIIACSTGFAIFEVRITK